MRAWESYGLPRRLLSSAGLECFALSTRLHRLRQPDYLQGAGLQKHSVRLETHGFVPQPHGWFTIIVRDFSLQKNTAAASEAAVDNF